MRYLPSNFRLALSSLALLGLVLLLAEPVFAIGLKEASGITDVPTGVPGASFSDPNTTPEGAVKTLASLMQRIANGLAAVAAAVAILFVVINGARLTFSFGDSEQLGKAKKGLIWAGAGLVLIIFAYVIAKSVIALTYSGADGSSAIGNAQVNAPATATEEPAAEEAVAAADEQCKSVPASLPGSCYNSGDTSVIQNGRDGVGTGSACDAGIARELNEVCSDLGVACNISSVQSKVLGPYATAKDPNCAGVDGRYGQCTVEAIKFAYQAPNCIK